MLDQKATSHRIAEATVVVGVILAGCATPARFRPSPDQIRGPGEWMVVEATGYCHCGQCCNWRHTCWGVPVIAQGPRAGQRKAVGITASGTKVRRGTVAADPAVLPFGTILWIPDYGWGRVEDTGSAVQGSRIDLYFPTHREAIEWGRRRVRVRVWRPAPYPAVTGRDRS